MLYFIPVPTYSLIDKGAFQMKQTGKEHIHFIGIGGSSMSGLAELAAKQGCLVSGSDRTDSEKLRHLREKGIRIYPSQSSDNITDDIDLVVYTLAVPDSNPELAEARRRRIPVVERGVYLGKIAAHYKYSVAVAGTHGKTSTTSMLSSIALCAGINPSIHIGGVFPRIGSNVLASHSDYFITEACEYHENFLNIHPYGGIILNVEAEHLDYYKNLEQIQTAFSKFAASCSEEGFLVVCADNPSARKAAAAAKCPVTFYSTQDASAPYYAADVRHAEAGMAYTLCENGTPIGDVFLHVPGMHNVSNSLAAAAAAIRARMFRARSLPAARRLLRHGRRFEKKATYHGVPVIDDYAHHPTGNRGNACGGARYPRPGRQNFCCIPAAYLFSGKLIPGGFHEGPEKSGYSHRDGDLFGAGKGSRYDLRSVYDAAFPGKRRTRKIHSGFFRNCGLSQILCKARRSHHYARRRRCQSCH